MTQDEEIEFDRMKTARDSLLLAVANLRGQLGTIAAEEREACARVCWWLAGEFDLDSKTAIRCTDAIRARGQA